jgi:hypothetical protein
VRDRNHEKGVLSDLHRLKPDDEVTVDRTDGTTAVFWVEQHSKDASRPSRCTATAADCHEALLVECVSQG